MKLTRYITALGLSLLFTACESDLEKVTFNPDTATPSTIKVEGEMQELYTLDANHANADLLTLSWSKPDMGYQASVTNLLQIDLKEKNFAHTQTVDASTDKVSYTFTTSGLNQSIQTLFQQYGMENQQTTIAFRIASVISAAADTIYSEALAINVMPYEGEAVYPSLFLPGAYNGWAFAGQQIYSIENNDSYSGMVYFGFNKQTASGDKEWKIGTDWAADKNWGADGNIAAEAAQATLKSGGGNISSYSHASYYVKFSTQTLKLEMSQGHDSWGIIGINGKWGDADDIAFTLQTETSSDGNTLYYLGATIEVTNGNTFKIRPDHQWNDQINAGNMAYEGDITEAASDQNFELTAGNGEYEIKWYFNKAVPKLTAHKK